MKIATGYFAKAKEYHDIGYALVNVALKKPWFLSPLLTLHELWTKICPTEAILQVKDKPEVYSAMYNEHVLGKVTRQTIFEELQAIADMEHTDKVVLLCYESPGKFCHRHLIADWFNDGTLMDVREIDLTPNLGDLFEQAKQ